jgi:chaperonin GroES
MTTNTTKDPQPDARSAGTTDPSVTDRIRPLHDRILAQRVAEQAKTSGGLFIPDNAKEKPLEAVVIAVGSGKLLDNGKVQPIGVKAGDKILIAKYAGSDVKLVGKDHIIVREDDVLGVLEEGNQ